MSCLQIDEIDGVCRLRHDCPIEFLALPQPFLGFAPLRNVASNGQHGRFSIVPDDLALEFNRNGHPVRSLVSRLDVDRTALRQLLDSIREEPGVFEGVDITGRPSARTLPA